MYCAQRFAPYSVAGGTASVEGGGRSLQVENLVRAGRANSRLGNLRYEEVFTCD